MTPASLKPENAKLMLALHYDARSINPAKGKNACDLHHERPIATLGAVKPARQL